MNVKDIIKVVRDFPEVVKMESEYICQDAYYQGDPIPSKDWAVLESLVYCLRFDLSPIICAVTGKHKFVEDSDSGDVESGYFSFYCERCGFGQSGYMSG